MESVFLRNFASQRAHSQTVARELEHRSGRWFASLVANNPRAVQSFQDHERVASKLVADRELQTLFDVASSGYLDGPASRIYRRAYVAAVGN